MSRSKRRRKDTAWCRCCDEAMVPGNGLGRCSNCIRRTAAKVIYRHKEIYVDGPYQLTRPKRTLPSPDRLT